MIAAINLDLHSMKYALSPSYECFEKESVVLTPVSMQELGLRSLVGALQRDS